MKEIRAILHSWLLFSSWTKSPYCLRYINFPRLVTSYTLRFEHAEPELALEYYFTLKDRYESVWIQCVKELVLDTKEFTKMLGMFNFVESLCEKLKAEQTRSRRLQLPLRVAAQSTCTLNRTGRSSGKRNPDGGVQRGAIDKFVPDRKEIVTIVAEAAEARGLNEEAVALYDLGGQKGRCVELLTKLLALQVGT